jgi:predicted hotdog family 3-hydroxylacyl-ACP dehydratase
VKPVDEDPRAVLPHRPPILAIERVVEVDSEHAVTERVVAEGRHVHGGELWEPALVEGLAQTAAVLNAHHEGGAPHRGMLVGVKQFEIHRRPRVGERLRFHVELIRRLSPLTLMRCRVESDGECVASGQLKFFEEVADS